LNKCPHPTVRSSYIDYLRPLILPCADLSVPAGPSQENGQTPPPLPSRRNLQNDSDPSIADTFNDSLSDYEMSVYVEDDMGDIQHAHPDHITFDRQWRYEEEPYYDDIFHDEEYIEDHFNSDEEDSSVVSGSNCFYRREENDTISNNDNTIMRTIDLEQQPQQQCQY
jgi:hypothetical protein